MAHQCRRLLGGPDRQPPPAQASRRPSNIGTHMELVQRASVRIRHAIPRVYKQPSLPTA